MGVVEDQGYWFGFAINTATSGNDRRVEFDIDVEFSSGVGFPVPPTPIINARRIEFTPQNSGPIDNAMEEHFQNVTEELSIGDSSNIRSQIGNATGTASIVASFISSQTRFNVGSRLGSVRSALPNRVLSVNSMNIGDVPYENSREVNFPVIRIPEGPGESFSSADIPDLIIEAELVLSNSPNLTTTEDIPADFIFEGVDVTDQIGCGELYSNIENDIGSIRDRIPSGGIAQGSLGSVTIDSLGERLPVREARNTLQDRIEDIPVRECRRDLLDELSDLPEVGSCADVTGFYDDIQDDIDDIGSRVDDLQDTADSIRNRVEGIEGIDFNDLSIQDRRQQLDQFNISDIVSRVEDAEDELESIRQEAGDGGPVQQRIDNLRGDVSGAAQECLDQLEDRLQNVRSDLRDLRNIGDLADVSVGTDRDAIDIEAEVPQFDCSTISSLNNRVREHHNDIINRTGPGVIIQPDRAQDLIEESESLLDEVEDVDDRNPCKVNLRNSLESSINMVRESEPETCTEVYPELENAVDELEARAVSFGGGISEAEIQQTNDLANELIDRIQDEVDQDENPECIENFNERVQSSITRLGQEVNTVRVIQAIGEEARERQQEQVNQLQQNLEDIRERAGGIQGGINL